MGLKVKQGQTFCMCGQSCMLFMCFILFIKEGSMKRPTNALMKMNYEDF